jgi:hypothetical protein
MRKGIRPAENINYSILLVYPPAFFVAEHGEYSNMHRVQRLYYGRISCAILGQLIFSTGLKSSFIHTSDNVSYLKVQVVQLRG